MASYITESNEDTFKPDTVFDSFHHQEKILISDRALLTGFLMLWLKRCIVPMLPYEVIISDVVCLAVLLVYGRSLGLLSAMVGCLQSGLQVLCRRFCDVVAEEDRKGNVVVGLDGEPTIKTPNPRVGLHYMYFMAWYVMHCSSMMSAVQSSEDSMPFIQRLERSNWTGWYMLII